MRDRQHATQSDVSIFTYQKAVTSDSQQAKCRLDATRTRETKMFFEHLQLQTDNQFQDGYTVIIIIIIIIIVIIV